MKKKILATLLSVVLVGSILVACGNGNDQPAPITENQEAAEDETADETADDAPEANDGLEPVELTVALWNFETQAEFSSTLDAWTELNPHITFNIIDATTADYEAQMTTQIAGGTSIDIMFMLNRPFLATLAENGQLMDLTDEVRSWGREAEFGTALEMTEMDGRLYAAPWRQDFWPLFYNKDLFEAAGLDLPDNISWQEFHDIALLLTEGEDLDKVYGAHLHTWNSIVQCLSAAQLGEDMIQEDYSWLAYLYEIYISLQDQGAIMDLGTIQAANVGYRPRFEDQQAAMIVMGSWYIGELAERAEFNWGIAPVPHMPGATEYRTMGNVTPVGIPITASHPEEALRFIEWVTGEEGASILAGQGIPSAFMNDTVRDIFFGVPGMPLDELSQRAFNPDVVVPEWPLHPLTTAVDQILTEEHELIFVGDNTIEEGIQNMNQRVSELLQ